MPFQDLPYLCEKCVPSFDDADPTTIWRYFKDLDLLFQKHSISNNAEKKCTTAKYTSITVVLCSTSAANRNGTHLVRRVVYRSSGLSEVCIRSVPT